MPAPATLLPLLAHRRGIGDQPIIDWLDVVRLAQPVVIAGKASHCVEIKALMAAWGCAQCSVSRRLRAVNMASRTLAALGSLADGAQIGRIVRVHRKPGFWRVVFDSSNQL